jgi:hypothetical protein
MNSKKKNLDSLMQISPLEETCSIVRDLTPSEVNQMLLELELYQTALELRIWKAGTRAGRMRLTQPLIQIVKAISILSCLKQKQLSTQ